jgi:hypothetical protein
VTVVFDSASARDPLAAGAIPVAESERERGDIRDAADLALDEHEVFLGLLKFLDWVLGIQTVFEKDEFAFQRHRRSGNINGALLGIDIITHQNCRHRPGNIVFFRRHLPHLLSPNSLAGY